MTPSSDGPLLDVRGVSVHFTARSGGRDGGTVRAVDGVSLSLGARETLALVGESGSGKSSLARAIVGLNPIHQGTIRFRGRDLSQLTRAEQRANRRHLQMVFQNPRGSLNPRMQVAACVAEPLRVNGVPRRERDRRVAELLELVGLTRSQGDWFPGELSGGQQQRVGIARALALEPSLLILDEPVSALDVSVQAQIVNLLVDLQERLGLAYLFISHDLAVVAGMAHRVAVMFLGRLVEIGPTSTIVQRSVHPYTQALLSAVPISDPADRHGLQGRIVLSGDMPSPVDPPSGCRFRTRCWKATDRCADEDPPMVPWDDAAHRHACLFPETTEAVTDTTAPHHGYESARDRGWS